MASSQDCLDLPLDALIIAQQPRHNHPLSRPNMSSSSPLMELLRRGKKIEAKNPQPPSEKMSSSPIMELLKHEKQPEEKNYQAPSEHGKQSEAKASQLSDSILREVFELHDEISVRKRMQKAAARDAGTVEKTTPSLEFRTCQKMTSSLLSSLYEFIVESLQKSTMVEEAWERLRESIFYEGQPVASLDSTALNDNGSKETIAADFGGSAIGRVSPLDSGFWWIILLRAYTEFTGDHTLREPSEVTKEMRLILKLCLSDDFDTSPTLLCADGCSMIDSRMGICGYPVEIQELFCFALRCAMQLLKPEDTDKDSCDSSGSKEIIAADFGGSTSVPDMAHAGKDLRLSGNKRKGEDDEPDRANKRPIARLGRPRPPIEVYRLDHGARITEVAPTLYSVENRDHVHLVGSIGSVGHMWGISRIESALSQCLISADIDPARHIEHLYYSRRTDCWGEVQSLPTPSEAADWRQHAADWRQHAADWRQFKSSVMGVLVRKGDLQV